MSIHLLRLCDDSDYDEDDIDHDDDNDGDDTADGNDPLQGRVCGTEGEKGEG